MMKSVFKKIQKKFSSKDKAESKSEELDSSPAHSNSAPAEAAASSSAKTEKSGSISSTSSRDDKDRKKDKDRKRHKDSTKEKERGPSVFSDMQTEYATEDLLKPIPSFQNAAPADRPALFVKKLRLCSVIFEFEPDRKERAADDEPGLVRKPVDDHPKRQESEEVVRAKDVKRQLLLELVDHVGKNRNFVSEPILVEILKMVSTNLFRALPAKRRELSIDEGFDPEEDEVQYEAAWHHIQIVYEFFLRFIVSNDVDLKILKKYINGVFVLHVLELFDSEDPRERDYLKTILHRIYSKFMSLRAFIRKAINNCFYSFIYDTEHHNGVAELLEILGSIINGFALPLKQEHKTFLQHVLLPMHKVRGLAAFHQQLSYCVSQFVNKDAELAIPAIKGLIRLWPVTNSAKEVLFLNELEEILELTHPPEFKKVCNPLFRLLSKAIGSPHFQVAERALFLWHNEYISSLIADHREIVLPIIFPVLQNNSKFHWNPTVNNLTVHVLKIFMEIDATLVNECQKRYLENEKKREQRQKQREETWRALSEAHKAK